MSACRVAAKLGLAAYYELLRSSAPTTVKINTMWTHNQNQNTTFAVHNLLGKMPGTLHLQQGKKWDTQGTFFFRYFMEAEVLTTAAVLHESLVLMADIRPGTNTVGWEPWHHVWVPEKEFNHAWVDGRLGILARSRHDRSLGSSRRRPQDSYLPSLTPS